MELQLLRKNKIKYIHLFLLIIGTIFILLGAFHTNLWFDESYSVGMVNHSFQEIWSIASKDVHPVLYYYLLKIVEILFPGNIMIYRLFSCMGIVLLGILGFTHIRKDFDEKTGILFTFFCFFLPIMPIYASEIRMYSWTILFSMLTFIYMYRIIKENNKKNWIYFSIFSLSTAYLHYYGLMVSFFMNLFLFIYFIKNKKSIKYFIISAMFQILLYIPWIIHFLTQAKSVSQGFWITFSLKTILEVLLFPFQGNLSNWISFFFLIFSYVIIFSSLKKNKIIGLSFFFYHFVIFVAVLISLKTPILVPRYLFCVLGLFILSLSFAFRHSPNSILYLFCILIFLIGTSNTIHFIRENYDDSNQRPIEYIKKYIKEDDIILYTDVILGANLLQPISQKQYFYDIDNWNVEDAYRAFSNLEIIKDLSIFDTYKGNIWIIDSEENRLYNLLKDYEWVDARYFQTKYHSLNYSIHVVRK